jgi:hypothetical protein
MSISGCDPQVACVHAEGTFVGEPRMFALAILVNGALPAANERL